MSKRYGRNQRRKHREQLQSFREAEDRLLIFHDQEVRAHRRTRRSLENARAEIAQIIEVLKPATRLDEDFHSNRKITIATELKFTHPVPEARYDLDMQALCMLRGEEARNALAIKVAQEIAEFFARKFS